MDIVEHEVRLRVSGVSQGGAEWTGKYLSSVACGIATNTLTVGN